MFLGHFALAFGAKRVAPGVSLATLFLACQFADLLWPTLLVLGLEQVEIDPGNTVVTPLNFVSYPYSHSLLMMVVWAVVLATLYRLIRGWRPISVTTVGALVFSHYLLDWITHRPDLPVTIGGATKLGLGLWNYPGTTLAAESLLFITGAVLYTSVTRARDRIGQFAFWSLLVTLVAIYFAALYGPPPPSVSAVAMAGHLSWLFVVWAAWVDRHRVPRTTRRPSLTDAIANRL
jgi:hypothetical protein